MTTSVHKAVHEYAATFFTGNRIVTKMLSEVLKNKANHLYLESLGLASEYRLPVFLEETDGRFAYIIRSSFGDQYELSVNGSPCSEYAVENGGYVSVKNRNTGEAFRVFFLDTSELKAGYKKYRIDRNTNIFIGRSPANDISCKLSNYISREKHAAIRIDEHHDAFIEDLKRSIGIYVNGIAVHSQKLNLFDEIWMMGLSIIYMGDYIAVRSTGTMCSLHEISSFPAKQPSARAGEKEYFVCTPRIMKSLEEVEIEIDAPPAPVRMDQTPAILTIGPRLTMSLVMVASMCLSIVSALSGGSMATVIVSAMMAVAMLMGSLMWPTLLRKYKEKHNREEEAYRQSRYTSYIAEIENELIEKRNHSARILNESLCPSPEILCAMLDSEEKRLRLWERSAEDEDFLCVRIGLGTRPFQVKMKIPKQGFELYEDELRKLSARISEKYSVINNVPLTLDLCACRTVGMIGIRKNIFTILDEIILNVIALHSCDDVKLVIVTSPGKAGPFDKFRNVPHIWSNDKKTRFYAENTDEVHYIFNIIDETIKERLENRGRDVAPLPHFVVIAAEPELVEREALLRYAEDDSTQAGISFLFVYGDITSIPKFCKTIIQSDHTRTGYYIKNKNANRFIPFEPDQMDQNLIRRFTGRLAALPIKRDSRSMSIADSVTFLQMYRAGNVGELDIESRWESNNSEKSLAAPIGVMAGGEVFSLDLHEAYHGCHGLVAGTTGSGKSEFLQALVLSLAINFSPREVAFVLVDFKGGDMARPFMAKPFAPALPHLAATISNLSGNVLYRALVSLEAEIKYRQRVFNEAAASLGIDKLNINSYHKYYKGGRLAQPLPHLIIIIDEFAQLKTQQPEFLTQLINVAQVGRSLGIHLILATQKPSGIVDPQIMSNSRFRACLKVAEKQDSVDMLNKPDAAFIKNPGRLYLQVGYDEIYECMQAGFSGADYVPAKTYMPEDAVTVLMTDHTANPIRSAKPDLSGAKTDQTQLEAIVAEITALGTRKNLRARPLWQEMLPEKIYLKDLETGSRGLCCAMIGLADFVRTQEQRPLKIDFHKYGHAALYGAGGMGKTTFLHTIVYSMVCGYGYTPEELNLYAMDFGGRNLSVLSELPHTGGVVCADEEEKISELASLLQGIIEERKRIFAGYHCGTFSDCRAVSSNILPAILVIIDNYASFRDKYMDIAERFLEIISAGSTFGVYFLITGTTRNSIHYKVREYISQYYTLKMNDPGNYQDILNVRPPVTPENISGRGITVINREVVEFQTALVSEGETESDRMSFIHQKYTELDAGWNGYRPAALYEAADPSAEKKTSAGGGLIPSAGRNVPDPVEDESDNLILGSSRSGAMLYGVRLPETYRLCVCADGAEDLRVFWQRFLANIGRFSDRETVFIDDGTYRRTAEEFPSCRYIEEKTALDDFIEELKPELNARLEAPERHTWRLFIVIPDFNRFFDMITDEQAAFIRKVLRYIDDPAYRIFFACGFDVNGSKNNDKIFMSLIVNPDHYVICPGCYEKAAAKIENLPLITGIGDRKCYFCAGDKNTEIRW